MKNSVHGVTTETMKNLLLDAGKIVINYLETGERNLGSTLGGNTFDVTAEIRDIRPDGAKGKIKGGRRIVDVAVTLTVNMFEMTKENLLLALPGATSVSVPAVPGPPAAPAHDKISRNKNLSDTDYVKNITYIGTISGKNDPVVIQIFNAMNDGSFSVGAEDKNEASTELTFSGHFDPAAMEAEPWAIRYPTL